MSDDGERKRELDLAAATGEAMAALAIAKFQLVFDDPVLASLVARELMRDAAKNSAHLVVADFSRRRKDALNDAARWSEDMRWWMSRQQAVDRLTEITTAAAAANIQGMR